MTKPVLLSDLSTRIAAQQLGQHLQLLTAPCRHHPRPFASRSGVAQGQWAHAPQCRLSPRWKRPVISARPHCSR